MRDETAPTHLGYSRKFANRSELMLFCDLCEGAVVWTSVPLDHIWQAGLCIVRLVVRKLGLQTLTANIRLQQAKSVGYAFAEPLWSTCVNTLSGGAAKPGPMSKAPPSEGNFRYR